MWKQMKSIFSKKRKRKYNWMRCNLMVREDSSEEKEIVTLWWPLKMCNRSGTGTFERTKWMLVNNWNLIYHYLMCVWNNLDFQSILFSFFSFPIKECNFCVRVWHFRIEDITNSKNALLRMLFTDKHKSVTRAIGATRDSGKILLPLYSTLQHSCIASGVA